MEEPEVAETEAVEAAPGQETTEILETEEVNQEVVEEQEEKTFTQAELDDIVTKRLAREKRKASRVKQEPKQVEGLDASQFDSVDDFVNAVAEQKVKAIQEASILDAEFATYHDKEEDAREKYADFEQVAYSPDLKVTEEMAQAIRLTDSGPDVAYHLGKNPKEATRISKLSPMAQAVEIGKIEATLAAVPKPKVSK